MRPRVYDLARKAGFWRRAIGWFVDVIIIAAALQLLGMALYSPTDGHVQSGSSIVRVEWCVPLFKSPEGVEVPPDFHPNFAVDCTTSLLGAPFSRSATIGRVTMNGAVRTSVAVSFSLDAEGRYSRVFDLTLLFVPLFMVYRGFFENRGGRTLGRLIAGTKVVGFQAADAEAGWLLLRYLTFFAPLTPIVAYIAWIVIEPPFAPIAVLGPTGFFVLGIAVTAPFVVFALWAAIAVVQRKDTFYDRFAETRVIRTR
jgi:hypothetical protein